MSDRELVHMFLVTLYGPFFNHLIRSSSAGFTELILTGERVEAGIRSGNIQKDAASSVRSFVGKKRSVLFTINEIRAEPSTVQR